MARHFLLFLINPSWIAYFSLEIFIHIKRCLFLLITNFTETLGTKPEDQEKNWSHYFSRLRNSVEVLDIIYFSQQNRCEKKCLIHCKIIVTSGMTFVLVFRIPGHGDLTGKWRNKNHCVLKSWFWCGNGAQYCLVAIYGYLAVKDKINVVIVVWLRITIPRQCFLMSSICFRKCLTINLMVLSTERWRWCS